MLIDTLLKETFSLSCVALLGVCLLTGCQDAEEVATEDRDSAFKSVQPTVDLDVIPVEDRVYTVEELREALGANENAHFEKSGRKFTVALLTNSGAKTLEPLQGQPLKVIDLSQTHITDLSPLEGMELENIGMAETKIADISALRGMPLKHIDGTRSLIEDLSPLKGMQQLTHLFLEGAKVKDISPLKSLNLKILWLNGCPVEDLSPLQGMQLEQLNLCDTALQNLDTVKTMQLGTLWMRNTAVKELSPLSKHGLISLDVQGSAVNDLSALAQMTSLKRLNISETDVTDLSPVQNLNLERIIFTPQTITKGIDAIRNMASLQALDVSFDGVAQPLPPSVFWERYDAGDFNAKTE